MWRSRSGPRRFRLVDLAFDWHGFDELRLRLDQERAGRGAFEALAKAEEMLALCDRMWICHARLSEILWYSENALKAARSRGSAASELADYCAVLSQVCAMFFEP